MVLGFDPIAFRFEGYAVGWFGLFALLGLGAGVAVMLRQAQGKGLPRGALLDATAWALPVGVLAARLVYLVGRWDRVFTQPERFWQIPLDGLSLWGGLAVGGLAAASFAKSRGVDRRQVADAAAPGLALGIAVGRLGQFVDGAGQGRPTSLPWATQYASRLSATPDFGVPRHPAQLYDGLVALALCLLLLASARWPLASGVRFWAFLALYGAARVACGPVRLDPPFVLGLQADQAIALLAVAVALVHLARPLGADWLPAVFHRGRDAASA